MPRRGHSKSAFELPTRALSQCVFIFRRRSNPRAAIEVAKRASAGGSGMAAVAVTTSTVTKSPAFLDKPCQFRKTELLVKVISDCVNPNRVEDGSSVTDIMLLFVRSKISGPTNGSETKKPSVRVVAVIVLALIVTVSRGGEKRS